VVSRRWDGFLTFEEETREALYRRRKAQRSKTTELTMKAMLISFGVGLMVGVIYALLRVKSPAPPLVALAGLLGIVWGEQIIQRFVARKGADSHVSLLHDTHSRATTRIR
jgi:XapX domain-containing protein